MTLLTPTDINEALARRKGNELFSEALLASTDGPTLVRILTRYLHFNATFGACVAHLAGKIGVSQGLFRDPDEQVAILADRSMDVAADIFAAAIDEFGGSAHIRHTHRMLALATLKATSNFFQIGESDLQSIATINAATERAVEESQKGYGFTSESGESSLFQSIGFHIGSEILADEEFRTLNSYLRDRYPALVEHLETAKITINGVAHPSYIWVELHTTVETDHYGFALAGANRAAAFYTGDRSRDALKEDVIAGVRHFASVQTALMAALTEDK